jgi:hypothetical protein
MALKAASDRKWIRPLPGETLVEPRGFAVDVYSTACRSILGGQPFFATGGFLSRAVKCLQRAPVTEAGAGRTDRTVAGR